MNAPAIGRGCILHWERYEFADGEIADKFLVILGANYLAVLATSKPHRRRYDPGCNAREGYYHIPGGRDGFKKDTWLLLAEPVEIIPAELLSRALKGQIEITGQLREDIANAIRNCLKRCPDVSKDQLALL